MKYFYHNITKGILNETDAIDFMEEYEEGDDLYVSVAGNSLLVKVEDEMLAELKRIYKDEIN